MKLEPQSSGGTRFGLGRTGPRLTGRAYIGLPSPVSISARIINEASSALVLDGRRLCGALHCCGRFARLRQRTSRSSAV